MSRATRYHLTPAKEAAKCHLRAQTLACILGASDHTYDLALSCRLPKARLQSCPGKPFPITHLCTPAAHVIWTRQFHAESHRLTAVTLLGLSRRNTRSQEADSTYFFIHLLQTPGGGMRW